MSVRAKLAGFAVILAASLFAGMALGAVTGEPPKTSPDHEVHLR